MKTLEEIMEFLDNEGIRYKYIPNDIPILRLYPKWSDNKIDITATKNNYLVLHSDAGTWIANDMLIAPSQIYLYTNEAEGEEIFSGIIKASI